MVLSLHCGTRVNPNRYAVNLFQEVPKKTEEGYEEEAFRANFEHCGSRTARGLKRSNDAGYGRIEEISLSAPLHTSLA